jgi:hypothetical protein
MIRRNAYPVCQVRRNETDLAVLDFNKLSPQFYCSSTQGQLMLDIVVTTLLTVATVHSRRPKVLSQALVTRGLQNMSVSNTSIVYARQRTNVTVVL